jgi:AraC-like DNA-binding protein
MRIFASMNTYNLPDNLPDNKITTASGLVIHHYHSVKENSVKNKVISRCHIFSFLQEGEKEVHSYNLSVKFTPAQAILLPAGNSLMTERLSTDKHYRSFLLLFTDNDLVAFRQKYSSIFTLRKTSSSSAAFFLFQQDGFVKSFVQSLQQMLLRPSPPLAEHLLQIKFTEIMLYLCDRYPDKFIPFLSSLAITSTDLPIRNVVESNLYINLSLEELAFLCNMSLSTFKRKFEEIYGTSPARWFHLKRMQQAAVLLKHGKAKASEIHHELGYENLSSFVQAFKKEFGKTPKAFQQSI